MTKQEAAETYYAGAFPVNPSLPLAFDNTPNDKRPPAHRKWWGVPYIVADGDGCTLHRLDGGAWDRPTFLGHFGTLDDAVAAARIAQAESLRACPTCHAVTLGRYWFSGLTMMPDGEKRQSGSMCPVCSVEV